LTNYAKRVAMRLLLATMAVLGWHINSQGSTRDFWKKADKQGQFRASFSPTSMAQQCLFSLADVLVLG